MATYFCYHIPYLSPHVGTMEGIDGLSHLSSEFQHEGDFLHTILNRHVSEVPPAEWVYDEGIFYSMCAPVIKGDELDLWAYFKVTDSELCVAVFPHRMTILEALESWSYDL